MAVDTQTINETIINYVADVKNAMPIDRIFLFGSHAKGTATEQSDIDICFFSHSFENLLPIDIMTRLFRLTRKYKGIDIEPRGFPTSELENEDGLVSLSQGDMIVVPKGTLHRPVCTELVKCLLIELDGTLNDANTGGTYAKGRSA